MRSRAAIAAFCVAAAGTMPSASHAQGDAPAIERLRFEPASLCYGEPVRYTFSYARFPGGLAAVKEAEMAAHQQPPGASPLDLWSLAPDLAELSRHGADSGSFSSGMRFWRPAEEAPSTGVDLRVRMTLRLAGGQEATATTAVRYEGSCLPPPPRATFGGGETGRIAFETVTPTNTEFLTGSTGGNPAVVWGYLHLAPAPTPPHRMPAVILMPGAEGVGRRETRWAEELSTIGVATFIVDSLTGRGFKSATSALHTGAIIGDAYRALGLLATHPQIDPDRIALMGFSRGGVVALFSSLTRFQQRHGPPGVRFAAHLPFYPGCHVTYIDEEQVTGRPIRIFHGTADDWTPIAPCRAYAERLRRAGKDVQMRELPGARHAFDDPSLPRTQYQPNTVNPSRCFFLEFPGGRLVNKQTGHPLDPKDPCFSRGATVGYDPRAHAEAIREVRHILTAIFRLGP